MIDVCICAMGAGSLGLNDGYNDIRNGAGAQRTNTADHLRAQGRNACLFLCLALIVWRGCGFSKAK